MHLIFTFIPTPANLPKIFWLVQKFESSHEKAAKGYGGSLGNLPSAFLRCTYTIFSCFTQLDHIAIVGWAGGMEHYGLVSYGYAKVRSAVKHKNVCGTSEKYNPRMTTSFLLVVSTDHIYGMVPTSCLLAVLIVVWRRDEHLWKDGIPNHGLYMRR
jgi:hypothetical protein